MYLPFVTKLIDNCYILTDLHAVIAHLARILIIMIVFRGPIRLFAKLFCFGDLRRDKNAFSLRSGYKNVHLSLLNYYNVVKQR